MIPLIHALAARTPHFLSPHLSNARVVRIANTGVDGQVSPRNETVPLRMGLLSPWSGARDREETGTVQEQRRVGN